MKFIKYIIVALLLFCLLILYLRFPHGKRPMFSGWEQGEIWWSWQRIRYIDDKRRQLLVDTQLNTLLLIEPPASGFYIEDQEAGTRISISFLAMQRQDIFIPKSKNALFVISERDELTQQTIPVGLAECVRHEFAKPYGYSERSIADCMLECCTQDCDAIRSAVGFDDPEAQLGLTASRAAATQPLPAR